MTHLLSTRYYVLRSRAAEPGGDDAGRPVEDTTTQELRRRRIDARLAKHPVRTKHGAHGGAA